VDAKNVEEFFDDQTRRLEKFRTFLFYFLHDDEKGVRIQKTRKNARRFPAPVSVVL